MQDSFFLLLFLSFSTSTSAIPIIQPTSNDTSSHTLYVNTRSPALNLTAVSTTNKAQSNPLNPLLAGLVNLPFIGQSVNAISTGLTTFETGIAAVTGTDTTQDGLSAGGKCAAMTVIFARGTTEPGNVGLVAGPPFFDALSQMMGADQVTVQGVDYGASIEGFLVGGDQAGSQKMADLVNTAMTSCPNSQIVMSGYSQGGQLVHNAAALLPASTMAKVSSVVIFGDPNEGQAVTGAAASKTKVICHVGDNICDHGDLILIPHLTYGLDAQTAATFVAAQAGLGIGNFSG